jgi:hypothetical protein
MAMRSRRRVLVAALLVAGATGTPGAAHAQGASPARPPTGADSAAIRQAALDYIEGWYAGDAERMARAVHPSLAKRIVSSRGGVASRLHETTAAALVDDTRGGGGRDTPKDRQRTDVRILDTFGNAASVRIDAGDWVDYLHLARVDGRWVILNVLWEMRAPR